MGMMLSSLQIQQIMDATNRAMGRWRIQEDARLAKVEIVKRTATPFRNLWWYCMPGTTVTVNWPSGWTEGDHLGNQIQSADPNDHFRPWLETNVGKQGWDWDWRMGKITGAQGSGNGQTILSCDTLTIKFRKGKEKYASLFLLRYAKWV